MIACVHVQEGSDSDRNSYKWAMDSRQCPMISLDSRNDLFTHFSGGADGIMGSLKILWRADGQGKNSFAFFVHLLEPAVSPLSKGCPRPAHSHQLFYAIIRPIKSLFQFILWKFLCPKGTFHGYSLSKDRNWLQIFCQIRSELWLYFATLGVTCIPCHAEGVLTERQSVE